MLPLLSILLWDRKSRGVRAKLPGAMNRRAKTRMSLIERKESLRSSPNCLQTGCQGNCTYTSLISTENGARLKHQTSQLDPVPSSLLGPIPGLD